MSEPSFEVLPENHHPLNQVAKTWLRQTTVKINPNSQYLLQLLQLARWNRPPWRCTSRTRCWSRWRGCAGGPSRHASCGTSSAAPKATPTWTPSIWRRGNLQPGSDAGGRGGPAGGPAGGRDGDVGRGTSPRARSVVTPPPIITPGPARLDSGHFGTRLRYRCSGSGAVRRHAGRV